MATDSTVDLSHPFYINHSDQRGHVLVPITVKKKIDFVDDTIKEPSWDKEPFLFKQWNQCNNMILSWLTHVVESDIIERIIHAKIAREVWVDLQDQFSQKDPFVVFQIQKSIATISQGTMTVTAYFTNTVPL